MLYPSIDKLMKKLDSKYTLVTLAAKRARELQVEKKYYLEKPVSNKYVGVALEEFVAGYIDYEKISSEKGKTVSE